MFARVGRFLMNNFQPFLSLAMSLLTLSGETTTNLEGTTLLRSLDQALSFIRFRWPNHCRLLSCKHSLMLFNFNRFLSPTAEILSSWFPSNHPCIIPLQSDHIFVFNWQVSIPCSITIGAYAKYNLPFVPKDKPLLANKGTKSLTLHHPDPWYRTVKCTTSISYWVNKITKLSNNFKRLTI